MLSKTADWDGLDRENSTNIINIIPRKEYLLEVFLIFTEE